MVRQPLDSESDLIMILDSVQVGLSSDFEECEVQSIGAAHTDTVDSLVAQMEKSMK